MDKKTSIGILVGVILLAVIAIEVTFILKKKKDFAVSKNINVVLDNSIAKNSISDNKVTDADGCLIPENSNNDELVYDLNEKGGIICSSDKLMSLDIPPAALALETKISVKTISKREIGTSYVISPLNDDFLKFLKPCKQKIKLPNTEDGSFLIDPKIYKKNKYGHWHESNTSHIDKDNNVLSDTITEIRKDKFANSYDFGKLPVNIVSEMEKWEVYNNNKYNFQFKYPADWSVKDNIGEFKSETQISFKQKQEDLPRIVFSIEVFMEEDSHYINLDKIKQQRNDPNSFFSLIDEINNVTIDNVPGFGIRFDNKNVAEIFAFNKEKYQYQIYIHRGYEDDIEDILTAIFSTFRFSSDKSDLRSWAAVPSKGGF